MNLLQIANSNIKVVNPNIEITWMRSTGYTTDATGHRSPTYDTSQVEAQVQALSTSDLKHIDGLNIQGNMRSVYLYGNVAGVVRADQKGGDILKFPEYFGGPIKKWLVVAQLETWPSANGGWCKVAACLQT